MYEKDPPMHEESFYEDRAKQEYKLNDHYLINLVEYPLLDLYQTFFNQQK